MTRPRYFKNLRIGQTGPIGSIGLILPLCLLFALCLAAAFGCSGSQKTPALSTLECRVALLAPYLGELAPEVARDAVANGPTNLIRSLLSLGVGPDEIRRVGNAWHACMPKPPGVDAGMPTIEKN